MARGARRRRSDHAHDPGRRLRVRRGDSDGSVQHPRERLRCPRTPPATWSTRAGRSSGCSPDHVVLYDRATLAHRRPVQAVQPDDHLGAADRRPDGQLRDPAGQTLFIQSLLPRNARVTAVPIENVDKPAAMEPTTHRLSWRIRPLRRTSASCTCSKGPTRARRWIRRRRIDSAQGSGFDGALVAGTVVLFRSELRSDPQPSSAPLSYQVPRATRRHVITGLLPKTGYDVAVVSQGAGARDAHHAGRAHHDGRRGACSRSTRRSARRATAARTAPGR